MCFPISTLHFSVFIKDIVENLFYKNLGKGFEKAAGALRPGSLIMNWIYDLYDEVIVDPGLLIMDAHLCQWAENKTGRQEGYAQQEQQDLYTHLNDTT